MNNTQAVDKWDYEWLLYEIVLKKGYGLKLKEWQVKHGIFDEFLIET